MAEYNTRFPVYSKVPEPKLLFHPERVEHSDPHPLAGLLQYGPFSASLVHGVLNPIRLAAICPSGRADELKSLVTELEGRHVPRERREYLREFPGFSRVFRVGLVLESHLVAELPNNLSESMEQSRKPHLILAEAVLKSLNLLRGARNDFDVVLIFLPHEWFHAFRDGGEDDEDFDLHHHIKAAAATWGISTQLINDDAGGALKYFCRCSVAWRLGLALYTKAGGVPWKMAGADPDVAYIGISYALRRASVGRQFVTCCSQVFDADGAGLEFVAYETPGAEVVHGNPFLSKEDMYRVMTRSLALYQRRHMGRSPRKVIVHKSTEFRKGEVEGCLDAWRTVELELTQVQQDCLWRGLDIDPPRSNQSTKGQASRYPCDRGLVLPIETREALVWTQGNASETVGGRDFFKEGKGIPAPLLLRRFVGSGSWRESTWAILGLSKMNWNNDGLYDRLPVTLSYAKILAEVVGRMPNLDKQTFQIRYFM